MDLTTQCPQCGTIFSASLEQLQLRKGYIRCISCAHIFDGFEAVVSGNDQHASPKVPVPPPASLRVESKAAVISVPVGLSAVPSAGPSSVPRHTEPDAEPAVPSVVRQRSRPESVAPAAGAGPAFTISTSPAIAREAREDDRRFQVGNPVVDSSPEPVISQPRGVIQSSDRRTEPHTGWAANTAGMPRVSAREEPRIEHARIQEPKVQAPRLAEPRIDHARAPAPTTRGLYVEPRESEHLLEPEDEADSYQRSGRIGTYFWRLAVALGLVVLLGQLAYVYRMQVANEVPFLRPLIEQACVSLDCQVPYARNIAAISIQSSSLSSGNGANADSSVNATPSGGKSKPTAGSEALILQLVMRNTYDKPQEWPTLVLSLKDASGAMVVRKNLPPDTYLPEGTRARPFAAGGEIAVRVPIMLNGQKINGYQLDKYFQ